MSVDKSFENAKKIKINNVVVFVFFVFSGLLRFFLGVSFELFRF